MVNAKDIQPGDILLWQGFSKVIRGEVVRAEDGTLTVMTSADKGFAIKDVINSRDLRHIRDGVQVAANTLTVETAPILF